LEVGRVGVGTDVDRGGLMASVNRLPRPVTLAKEPVELA